MTLTDTGEARVNGYLFVLERSLKTFLPADIARDAVREIESHLRERIATADGAPNERAALENILGELGPPLRVAQAYSAERTIEEAVTTGRMVPMLRGIWHVAATTLLGSAVATGLFSAYAVGIGFIFVAIMKPIFPNNTGLIVVNGMPTLGAQIPLPPGAIVYGGYWIIPVCVALGVVTLVLTHKAARRYLASRQRRRGGA